MFNSYQENKVNPIWIAVAVLSSILAVIWQRTSPKKMRRSAVDHLEMSPERRYLINREERRERDVLKEEHC